MAEGTSTFMGRGVGLDGNYEIQGDNDTDDTLTITGYSSSAAGDILVVQNSTGTEFLVISASGLISTGGSYGISTNKLTVTSTGAAAFSGQISAILSSTLQDGALQINPSSTGAIAAGGTGVNAIYVAGGSKSKINAVLHYNNGDNASAQAVLGVSGSVLPSAFLAIGSSAGYYTGAGNVSGAIGVTMFTASSSYYLVSAIGTTQPLGLLKVLAGSKVFYLPLLTDTMLAGA